MSITATKEANFKKEIGIVYNTPKQNEDVSNLQILLPLKPLF